MSDDHEDRYAINRKIVAQIEAFMAANDGVTPTYWAVSDEDNVLLREANHASPYPECRIILSDAVIISPSFNWTVPSWREVSDPALKRLWHRLHDLLTIADRVNSNR